MLSLRLMAAPERGKWDVKKMFDIMLEISKTSLKVLGSEIFNQITKSK
ncbi:MAG: EcoRI family type II restriction endonuclease [bacterium]